MDHRRLALLRKVQWLYILLLALKLRIAIKSGTVNRSDALHALAISARGLDASPDDLAPDELGCAESVSKLISLVIPFKVETFTGYLFNRLNQDSRFELVYGEPQPGDIILSPTPFPGSRNVGHTGIFGGGGELYSNSSATGTWEQNYTYKGWLDRFETSKHLPTYVYRLK